MNYGSGWRKDVVNRCLEFVTDPACRDLAPTQLVVTAAAPVLATDPRGHRRQLVFVMVI